MCRICYAQCVDKIFGLVIYSYAKLKRKSGECCRESCDVQCANVCYANSIMLMFLVVLVVVRAARAPVVTIQQSTFACGHGRCFWQSGISVATGEIEMMRGSKMCTLFCTSLSYINTIVERCVLFMRMRLSRVAAQCSLCSALLFRIRFFPNVVGIYDMVRCILFIFIFPSFVSCCLIICTNSNSHVN